MGSSTPWPPSRILLDIGQQLLLLLLLLFVILSHFSLIPSINFYSLILDLSSQINHSQKFQNRSVIVEFENPRLLISAMLSDDVRIWGIACKHMKSLQS